MTKNYPKWSKNGHLCVSRIFSSRIEKKKMETKKMFLCCSFWSSYILDTFRTSKWTSALKFCERYSCSWHKMTINDCKIAKCKDCDIWTWTNYTMCFDFSRNIAINAVYIIISASKCANRAHSHPSLTFWQLHVICGKYRENDDDAFSKSACVSKRWIGLKLLSDKRLKQGPCKVLGALSTG